jgi:aminoglycoside 6'-N-acetyltransferase I
MKIVRAEERDREAWLVMRVALWPECEREASAKEITDVLEGGRQAAFLAKNDKGFAMGFVEVSTRDYVEGCSFSPVGYVEGIYVRPEHRGEGIGRELIRAAERWAQQKGCVEMGSDTRLDDTQSISFHEALGFRETDRQIVFLKSIAGEGIDG